MYGASCVQHGGIVQVGSERGEGTCFNICLPIQQHELQEIPVSEPVVKPSEGGAKGLVVEDDELVRKVVVPALMEGYSPFGKPKGEGGGARTDREGWIYLGLASDRSGHARHERARAV